MGWWQKPSLALAAAAAVVALNACATPGMSLAPAPTNDSFALAPAPAQFTAFCSRNPAECQGLEVGPATAAAQVTYRPASRFGAPPRNFDRFDWSQAFALPDEPVQISYAPPPGRAPARSAVVQQLIRINTQVNKAVRFRSDELLFGTDDFWSLPVRGRDGVLMGDCEDYALLKRSILLSEGFSPDSLSIAIVRTVRGDIHAVLLVSTAEGEMVLDSLTPVVGTWKQSRYTLIARQAAGNGAAWLQPA